LTQGGYASDQWSQPAGRGSGRFREIHNGLEGRIQINGTNVCNTINGTINSSGGSFRLGVQNLDSGVYDVMVQMSIKAQIGGGTLAGTAFAGGTFFDIANKKGGAIGGRQLLTVKSNKLPGVAPPPFSFDAASTTIRLTVYSKHPQVSWVVLYEPTLRQGAFNGFSRTIAVAKILDIKRIGNAPAPVLPTLPRQPLPWPSAAWH
jgi:hypothetical protein